MLALFGSVEGEAGGASETVAFGGVVRIVEQTHRPPTKLANAKSTNSPPTPN